MRIVVQKFGGTSVADAKLRRHVIDRVRACIDQGARPVLVVSAMGRAPEPYATDTLIGLIDPGLGLPLARDLDLLMSCGETISSVLLAHALAGNGIPARALTGWQAGIITGDDHGEALIHHVERSGILNLLEEGIVPVVAGFQGISLKGEITTLGRGGSDTTAAALGAVLEAERVEIFTDTLGIMSFDPKTGLQPRVLERLSCPEVGEFANEGARVLHRRAVELASARRVPLVVRSGCVDHPGTMVVQEDELGPLERERIVTGVSHIPDVRLIKISFGEHPHLSEARLAVFEHLAQEGISLDLININEDRLYFIVKSSQGEVVTGILKRHGHPFQVMEDCAKLSITGVGMRGTPGVMARIQKVLVGSGVNVIHSTDSHITISCLIRQADLDKALTALRDGFDLGARTGEELAGGPKQEN